MTQKLPKLEEVENNEIATNVTDLFTPEDVPHLAAKVNVLETLLTLLTRKISFDDFAREILMTALRTIKCEAGSIFEIDHENQNIFFRAASGNVSEKVVRFRIPLGHGVVGHVIESRQPMIVNDVQANDLHMKVIDQSSGFIAKNLIALPIVIRGQVFGVLELLNRVGDTGFGESDQEFLVRFCEYVSKVIEVRLIVGSLAQKAKQAS